MAQTKRQREEAQRLEDARAILDAHRAEEEARAKRSAELEAAAAVVEEAEAQAARVAAASARMQRWADAVLSVNWTDEDQRAIENFADARHKERKLMELRKEVYRLNFAQDVPPEWAKKFSDMAANDESAGVVAPCNLFRMAAQEVARND